MQVHTNPRERRFHNNQGYKIIYQDFKLDDGYPSDNSSTGFLQMDIPCQLIYGDIIELDISWSYTWDATGVPNFVFKDKDSFSPAQLREVSSLTSSANPIKAISKLVIHPAYVKDGHSGMDYGRSSSTGHNMCRATWYNSRSAPTASTSYASLTVHTRDFVDLQDFDDRNFNSILFGMVNGTTQNPVSTYQDKIIKLTVYGRV